MPRDKSDEHQFAVRRLYVYRIDETIVVAPNATDAYKYYIQWVYENESEYGREEMKQESVGLKSDVWEICGASEYARYGVHQQTQNGSVYDISLDMKWFDAVDEKKSVSAEKIGGQKEE